MRTKIIGTLLLAAVAAVGQTGTSTGIPLDIQFSPNSMSFTRSIGGTDREMGGWTIRVCNGSPDQAVQVDAERIYMAPAIPVDGGGFEALPFAEAPEIMTVLTLKKRRRPLSWLLGGLRWTGRACTVAVVAQFIQTEPYIGLACLGVSELTPFAASEIEEAIPEFQQARILTGRVSLPAGGCGNWLGFSALIPYQYVRPYASRIIIPVQQTTQQAPPIGLPPLPGGAQ